MIDQSVKEISAIRPKLRQDLRISCRDSVFILEDPLTGKFYEIGEREHAFVRMLDGARTLNEAVAEGSRSGGGLTGQEAISLLRMLTQSGLLWSESDDQAQRIRRESSQKRDGQQAAQKAKRLFFIKIPILNPDRFLGKVNALTSAIPGGLFVVVWFAVILWGLITYFSHSSRFGEEMRGALQVGNLAAFGVVWLLLKVVHEFCHGIVCKRFGGAVPEAGLSLLLFLTPLAFVDASSSIRFSSKWHRIFVAAAGMFGEFFVASLAIIAWANLQPGVLGSVLHQVVLISTVTTVLFNANPLMRFDGYYILSDLTGISNLFTKGQSVVTFILKKYILGIRGIRFPLRESDRSRWGLISIYGVAAALWKVVVVIGLFVAATLLFHGAGKILAIVVGGGMMISSIHSGIKYFKKSAAMEGASFLGISCRLATFTAVLVGLAFVIRISPGVTAPAVVDSGSEGEIRVECAGFVEECHVANGEAVKSGDILLELNNPESLLELANLERELRRAKVRSSLYFSREDIAAFQAEQKNIEGLEVKVSGQQKYVATLSLRAPGDGIVYGRDLHVKVGEFLSEGSVALRIINPEAQKIRIAIPQNKIETIGEIVSGHPVKVFAKGSGQHFSAHLQRIGPSAGTEIPHPGLTSSAGGPLVVKKLPGEEDAQLLFPHFLAVAELETGQASIHEGQLVWARFESPDQTTVAEWVWNKFRP